MVDDCPKCAECTTHNFSGKDKSRGTPRELIAAMNTTEGLEAGIARFHLSKFGHAMKYKVLWFIIDEPVAL